MLLHDILAAADLDVIYVRGAGDYLTTEDQREILDIAQGAGTGLFGHNHPEIVASMQAVLAERAPQQVQLSIRRSAGQLVELLSSLLGGHAEAYMGVLTNSGTESTEAALKHALLEHHARQSAAGISAVIADLSARKPHVLMSRAVARDIGFESLGHAPSVPDVMAAIERHNAKIMRRRPQFVALKNSFHGKSLGSLRVTFGERYRVPFLRDGEAAQFVDPQDAGELIEVFRTAIARLYRLETGEDGLTVQSKQTSSIAGFIYEPIQGEAGIVPVPVATLRSACTLCREHNVPLIADEIQTFARVGKLLASHALDIDPDYILLAKGLGGGMCKVGVALIRASRYQSTFSHLHTSTFAGDELSSRVALTTLDMLTRQEGALLRNGMLMGEHLLVRLRALQASYPDAIVAVRGRGLMIGVEFRPLTESAAWGIAMVGRASKYPALDLCAYLLHEAGVRTLPTLGQNSTIRIEPSLFIDEAAVDRIVAAIGRLAEVLSSGDSTGGLVA
jgi:acetylornithine/succinyldiaminopimelate/putrescine aminotransferase